MVTVIRTLVYEYETEEDAIADLKRRNLKGYYKAPKVKITEGFTTFNLPMRIFFEQEKTNETV